MIEPDLDIFPKRELCLSIALNDKEILIFGGNATTDKYESNTRGVFKLDTISDTISVVQEDGAKEFRYLSNS